MKVTHQKPVMEVVKQACDQGECWWCSRFCEGLAKHEETKASLKRFLASIIAEWYLFEAVRSSLSWTGEWVRSHSRSICRRADLRVDMAGVNHLLIGLTRMVIFLVLIGAYALRRVDRVVLYASTRSDNFGGGWVLSREWRMSRVNFGTLMDFMQRKINWDKGVGGTGEIERAVKIGKWSDGETDEWSMTGCREEEAAVITRSRIWWSRWVGKETCCVSLVESRADKNCFTWQSSGLSRWRLKSSEIRNSWGLIAARVSNESSSLRKTEIGTALHFFVAAGR